MCVVSYVGDHYMKQYPDPRKDWDWDIWKRYFEMRKIAEEYDKAMKQPDCPDPVKEDFFKQVLDRLEKIEEYVKPRSVVESAPWQNTIETPFKSTASNIKYED